MPRKSVRAHALEHLLSAYHHARRLFILDNIHQIVDGDLDDNVFNEDNDLFVLVAGLYDCIHAIRQNRYFGARSRREGNMDVFDADLSVENGIDSWMTDDEFLCKYRVTRDQLDHITSIIADDPIFARPQRGSPQMPVKHQLMIWLHFVGHEGQSNSTQ